MTIFGIQVIIINLVKIKGEKVDIISRNKSKGTAHVIHGNKYYIVSDNGRETLIFPSNKNGEIVSYEEVGGSVGSSLQYVLNNFRSQLSYTEKYGEG